ncbi:MAG TPA: response regulator [Acidiferrobacteraceae bacterium]|nr:response regulator [Acidiferrobacteraceae bacterium]
MMQGQKNLEAVSRLIMSELTPLISAQHGAFFLVEMHNGERTLELIASYAYRKHRSVPSRFRFGEGLVGQCAADKTPILLNKVPGNYIRVSSGLGEGTPLDILVLPVLFEGEVLAVIELASFQAFSQIHRVFLDQLMVSIGVVLNIISASMRTEELLQELQNSNTELEAQAKELEEKAKLLQIKNQEVELASLSLEDKAEQLALISKYKSEFLANMSHELRTPLNSLLIMAKLLADNKDANLNAKQVEFAATIYASGRDLLSLINEILDLSKVEAGKMNVVPSNVSLRELADYAERDFRPVAQQKGIDLVVDMGPGLPDTLYTDGQRLQQILKNLLSNAFKFTAQGFVSLSMHVIEDPLSYGFGNEKLYRAERVIRFSVQDTGIGIAASKQKLIFEAFQQVDATTSRRYGGTGLGLTISREISRLLGGEIQVHSEPGKGSTFSLFVPHPYQGSSDAEEIPQLGAALPDVSPYDTESSESEDLIEFDGEKVLVVDDDVRNIFAITSILENRKLHVAFAENGLDAINILEQQPDIRLVLMDVMMPEMDGYETTRAIRRLEKFKGLPIIALTAKAMKGDREKCLEAGVSEYITKPVDIDRLLRMIRGCMRQARVPA